jgi:hypothetical protein
MRFNEVKTQQNKVEQVRKFADWAMDQLAIENPPTINYGNDMGMVNKNRSYGSTNSAGEIWTHIGNRTPADAMRTLCHELIHHKQFELGTARDDMDDEQRLKIEDEANAIAGRMMRAYGKIDGSIYEGVANDKLKTKLLYNKKTDYDSIDEMMTDIADECDITPKQLHDEWVKQYKKTPDDWIKQQLKNINEDQWKFAKFVVNESNVDQFNIAFNIRQKRERTENPNLPFRPSIMLSSALRKLIEDKMWESRNDAIKDLKEFQRYLTTIDGRGRVNMAVGSEVAVIQFEPHTSSGVIEGRGFQTPKKIDHIEHQADGTIDYIEFSDGSSFPDAEFVSRGMGGEYEGLSTMFFSTNREADYAVTLASLHAPHSWKFSTVNIQK